MGGINLVRESERLVFEGSGFKIFYRRIPSHVRTDIVRRCTPRRGGDPDWGKISLQFLQYAVLDWEGVHDTNDAGDRITVPYDRDRVGFLPDEVQIELIEKLGENSERLEDDLKNSRSMPASSITTED